MICTENIEWPPIVERILEALSNSWIEQKITLESRTISTVAGVTTKIAVVEMSGKTIGWTLVG